MKPFLRYILVLLTIATITSCGSSKKIAYLQEPDQSDSSYEAPIPQPLYDARIMPKDLILISVSASDPIAVKPFNITVPSGGSIERLQPYLVDNNGQIDFPFIGMITVKGMTTRELESTIKEGLKSYLKETPVVTVSFDNYEVSVLGEVKNPRTISVTNSKVNIFEALAMAGDMTIWGKRDNVKIIREDSEGNKTITLVNLNSADIVSSPYYYLQQNDIVYVEPNRARSQSSAVGSATGLWFSAISVLLTITNILINVLK
ncbi:MAG: polysaccharide biosynthesis/export family protein [Fermentimonas sp.]|jgi:polysaccharide export outer membrane protein